MQAYLDESIAKSEIISLCYRASELPKETGLPLQEISKSKLIAAKLWEGILMVKETYRPQQKRVVAPALEMASPK